METFSLLKYWRGGGSATNSAAGSSPSTATIATSALSPTISSSFSDSDEEGSFFDLEFSVQEEAELAASMSREADVDMLRSEPVSPSGDMFFKANSIVISSDADTKPLNQFPVSLLKSATKMRVFLLGLKKSRSASTDQTVSAVISPKSKFLVVSLFSRDSGNMKQNKSSKEDQAAVSAEERKFAKEVVLKYLNKIRPLYVRVSKRYGEKLRFATSEGEETDAEMEVAIAPASATPVKEAPVVEPVVVACGVRAPRASVPAGLKEVCKRLGKSRSASAAVVGKAAAEAAPPQRRDDSLIQIQDGIQSAIAHCKRSFNSSSVGSESPLQRSMSDPGDGRLEIADGKSS